MGIYYTYYSTLTNNGPAAGVCKISGRASCCHHLAEVYIYRATNETPPTYFRRNDRHDYVTSFQSRLRRYIIYGAVYKLAHFHRPVGREGGGVRGGSDEPPFRMTNHQ